jgi:uncharacterized protein YjbI with pentapeptide repeats
MHDGHMSEPVRLSPFTGERLEERADYDGTAFNDLDLAGQDARDARFAECRFERCNLDGTRLPRVRLLDSRLIEVRGASVDLADSTWRGSSMEGARLGAVTLTGAAWADVRVERCKLGFVNLADARLEDVTFRESAIETLDLRLAQVRTVSFVDCSVDELNVSGASLAGLDLSGARLRSLVGVESLRGAIVSREQLVDLAPLFAEQLGIDVRD